jgi:hypothetical protein
VGQQWCFSACFRWSGAWCCGAEGCVPNAWGRLPSRLLGQACRPPAPADLRLFLFLMRPSAPLAAPSCVRRVTRRRPPEEGVTLRRCVSGRTSKRGEGTATLTPAASPGRVHGTVQLGTALEPLYGEQVPTLVSPSAASPLQMPGCRMPNPKLPLSVGGGG